MAGTYGHETEHLDNSIGIYDMGWKSKIESYPANKVLATGYSCRSQVKRLSAFRPRHPIEALSEYLS